MLEYPAQSRLSKGETPFCDALLVFSIKRLQKFFRSTHPVGPGAFVCARAESANVS